MLKRSARLGEKNILYIAEIGWHGIVCGIAATAFDEMDDVGYWQEIWRVVGQIGKEVFQKTYIAYGVTTDDVFQQDGVL